MSQNGLQERETFDHDRLDRLERILAEDTSGACGIAAIQSARGATREVVDLLLRSICDNDIRAGIMIEKRGPNTGDGAGLTLRTDSDEAGRGMQDFLKSHVGREVPLTRPGYGYAVGDGLTMRHRGVVQNETGEIQSGGRIVVMPPDHAHLVKRNDLPLVGNTLGYGARGGDRFIQASIGDRGCIRETGGRTFITGNTGKYFGEYKTGGRDIVLGEFFGEVGPGMSGGEIYALDSNLPHKLSGDAMITAVLRRRDLERIFNDHNDFHRETDDDTVARMLVEWARESRRFHKVISRGQYAASVFQWLYNRSKGREYPFERKEELIADLFEMCGYDVESDTRKFSIDDVAGSLDEEWSLLEGELARLRKPEQEQIFMFTRRFATEATARIRQRFISTDAKKHVTITV